MLDFSSLFSVFESTDSPLILTEDYKSVKNWYNEIMHPESDLDLFNIPNAPELEPILFVEEPSESDHPITFKEKSQLTLEQIPKLKSRVTSSNGYNTFKRDMESYERSTGDVFDETKRVILTNFAKLESGFRLTVGNPVSSALGYFLVIRSNRKDMGTDALYASNVNALFRVASRLYDNIRRQYSKVILKGKDMGLSELQIMYGFWFNPASMVKYINSGGKSDGFSDRQGTTLTKILNRAKELS